MGDELNENKQPETESCNFCDDDYSRLLIRHEKSYICDECVKLSYSIINDHDEGYLS